LPDEVIKNRERWILLLLFFAAVILRAPLIGWFSAEYTDSILYITIFYNDHTFYLPLYGALISLLYDNLEFIPTYEMAGRAISIVAGSLSVIPIYLTAKLVFNERTGIYASILFTLSAVALRWDLRAMSDSLFTLFFMASFYFIIKFYYAPAKRIIFLAVLFAGLASITRYQGLALLPLIAFISLREIREKRSSGLLVMVLALPPWIALLWWIEHRGFGHTRQYEESLAGSFAYIKMAAAYLVALPYAMTLPVFVFFCYGLFSAWKTERGRPLILFFLALFIPWLIMHTLIRFLVIRYFLPLFPLFMIFAAYGITRIRRERAAISICIAVTIIFSASVLYFQRDSFGDIKRAAVWIRHNASSEAAVYSTDINAFKTKFWARRDVLRLTAEARLKPGDFLVLNSFYVPIPETRQKLAKNYQLDTVFESVSSNVALLTDVTVPSGYTNSPAWLRVNFKRNEFKSVVLKVRSLKE
jgi:4-amino-4-deoxy-L-arabinose transferase-like glycosyltransferase